VYISLNLGSESLLARKRKIKSAHTTFKDDNPRFVK